MARSTTKPVAPFTGSPSGVVRDANGVTLAIVSSNVGNYSTWAVLVADALNNAHEGGRLP